MFENEMKTRIAIWRDRDPAWACPGAGPSILILLIVPVAVLFLGLVADPEETHAAWYGMLNMLGIFDLPALTDAERELCGEVHYFGSARSGWRR